MSPSLISLLSFFFICDYYLISEEEGVREEKYQSAKAKMNVRRLAKADRDEADKIETYESRS